MTSKFKAQTGNTQLLSSEGNTEAKARPSSRLVGMTTVEKATPLMTITPTTSKSTLTTGKKGLPSERAVLSAMMFKAAVGRLKKDGLVKSYRVLSEDKTTVTQIVISLPAELWTESLDLRVLSEPTTEAK